MANSLRQILKPKADQLTLREAKRGIPKDLLYIFVPTTVEGLEQYLNNVRAWNKGEENRQKVFRKWFTYINNLPLQARKWDLRKIQIAINIIEIKQKLVDRWKPEDDGYGYV